MLNDKQHFVMGVRFGMLSGQDRIKLQVIAIGHLIGKIRACAFGAGIIWFGWFGHDQVTALRLWNSG